MYTNTFETQAELDTVSTYPENIPLQGTFEWDAKNPLAGAKSYKMMTNPNVKPYYYYFFSFLPYDPRPVRLETLVALNTSVDTFGIGWQVLKEGRIAIMFVRFDFGAGVLQFLKTTAPHVWTDIVSIPFDPRRNSILQPFKMWIEIDPGNWQYLKFGYHAFCKSVIPNYWEYNLNTLAEHAPTDYPDGLVVKINPQGVQGVTATAWIDNVEATVLLPKLER